MIRVCAWCKKDLDTGVPLAPDEKAPITHGICPDCMRSFLSEEATPLKDFLDIFPHPVFLVDSNAEIIGANSEGLSTVGKKLDDIKGQLSGDVFECVNAEKGCGSTIHCKTCTIRKTITETYRTGKSSIRVPAYPDFHNITNEKVRYLISTEKSGKAVLLQIDDICLDNSSD